MADPGAVERNVMYADIALQRASQRNGGQNAVPSSVTGADAVPSQAVNTTNPPNGGE